MAFQSPEEQALNQQLAPEQGLAAVPLPPDAAAGVPIAPPVDNAGGALPPELLEILMMILGGGAAGQAGGGALDPILGALMGAQQEPAGLDGQAIGGLESIPPIDDVVQ